MGRKSPDQGVRNLFANPQRLLEYYHLTTAVARCKIKFAVWEADGKEWEVPKNVKFPVVLYDIHDNMVVAKSVLELSTALGRRTEAQQVLLLQVPVGARFAWVEFEKGKKPFLVNPEDSHVKKLDWEVLNRIDKINQLFFGDGVSRFRLQFAVDSDDHFTLMDGVICGY